MEGLQPDRLYYYQIVSRDDAGNPTVDDNQGRLYTFRTSAALAAWSDSLNSNKTNWSVVEGVLKNVNWQLGVPQKQQKPLPIPRRACSNISKLIDTTDTMVTPPSTCQAETWPRFVSGLIFTDRSEFDIHEYGPVYISTNSSGGWTLPKSR